MLKPRLTENRYSVCVGINCYDPAATLSPLHFAEADALAMDEMLGKMGFAYENRRLLLGESASLAAVNAALSEMILDKANVNDLVVFYFAGHSVLLPVRGDDGDVELQSEVFLAPYDFASQKILRSRSFRLQQALGMERVRQTFFESEGSRKRLFLFDSCYSGDFYGPRYRDEHDPVQGYIKHMLDSKSTGRVALSSCLPIQSAVEDPALGHGRFTYHILQALSGAAPAALRADGSITVNSLFDYIAEQLPRSQRPVLSGVQQDSFELVRYPELVVHPLAPQPALTVQDNKRAEREQRLRAMIADHRSFIQGRLASFVGRQSELAEIRQRITEKLQTGGYITITGLAGQGKSSMVARLIEEYGSDQRAFHFIPFNPGPDHQVELLRSIMARLILKYDLSDLYVASESRPVLRASFAKVLTELVAKEGQEVIFIDGLDQLKEDADGERDLSFLPDDLPPGIVFVLGTRPDDLLRPLHLRKPHTEYRLPDLSRQDFDLILKHRHVQLEKHLADEFYRAMQQNALYLDLAARELAQRETLLPATMIKHITEDPDNIFSLSMMRLKRKEQQWREILKPILGVLLVAREPLAAKHIRQIINAPDESLRAGIERLGGLLEQYGQQRYYLYHLKLQDYLRQDEHNPEKKYIFASDEEIEWQKKLAHWCEQTNILSVPQHTKLDPLKYRQHEYSFRHYIAHLYYAHEWQKLCELLDTEQYGRVKMAHDPSMRSYVQDLDIGRQVASWEGWELTDGIAHLPRLWKYTLLRSSLTSRADTYTPQEFEILMLLKHEQEAIGLAELLTQPDYQAEIFALIGTWLEKESSRRQEGLQWFMRAQDIAISSPEKIAKISTTISIVSGELAQIQEWDRAEAVANSIKQPDVRLQALASLCNMLIQAHEWDRAKSLARTFESKEEREVVEQALSLALVHAGEWDRAESLEDQWGHEAIQQELGMALIQAGEWDRAEVVACSLESMHNREIVRQALGIALVQAGEWDRAEKVSYSLKDRAFKIAILQELIKALVTARSWIRAATIWDKLLAQIYKLKDYDIKVKTLQELAQALTQMQQCERAELLWDELVILASTVKIGKKKIKTRQEIIIALVQAKQDERLELLLKMLEDVPDRNTMQLTLGIALVQAGEWDYAEAIVRSIESREKRDVVRQALASTLVQAGKWDRAEAIVRSIESREKRDAEQRILGIALVQAQEWYRAIAVIILFDSQLDGDALRQVIGVVLAQAQEWYRERTVIPVFEVAHSSAHKLDQDTALQILAFVLNQAVRWSAEQERTDFAHFFEYYKLGWEALSIVLVAAQEWIRAGAAESEPEREVMLEALCMALAQAGEWERTVAVARSLESEPEREVMLEALGVALAQAGEWERAVTVAHSLESESERDTVLEALGVALAQAGEWERAEVVARSIEHKPERNAVLEALGVALAQAGEWERAEVVAHSIEYKLKQEMVLQTLSVALVQAGEWERAEVVARSLADVGDRNAVLQALIFALVQAGELDRAEVVWDEIRSLTHPMQSSEDSGLVLQKLGLALAKIPLVEYAEAVTHFLGNKKVVVLEALGVALAQMGEWEPAERVAHSLENEQKDTVLRALGIVLVQAQEWDRAEVVARSIETSQNRNVVRQALVTVLIQAGKWERAERMAYSFAQEWDREEALQVLGVALAQMGKWEYAEKVASSIGMFQCRNTIRQALVSALLQAGEGERAEALVHSLTDERDQNAALRALGVALAQTGEWDRAEMIACSIKIPRDRDVVQQALVAALAQAGEWDRAEAVIGSVEDGQSQDTLRQILGVALANARVWERTEMVIHSFKNMWNRDKVWRALGVALANAGEWDRAEAVARSLTILQGRNEVRRAVSIALAQAGEWDRAEAVIHVLTDVADRNAVRQALFSVLVQAEELDRAETIAYLYEQSGNKDSVLFGNELLALLVEKLVQVRQWKRVRTILYKIEDDPTKISVLKKFLPRPATDNDFNFLWIDAIELALSIKREDLKVELLIAMAANLAKDKQYEYVLLFVQYVWNHIHSRELVLNLLSIAHGLLPLNPQVSLAFCEALAWVNTMLVQYPITDRKNEENLKPRSAYPDMGHANKTMPTLSSGFALGNEKV